jgi:hypothetical protein
MSSSPVRTVVALTLLRASPAFKRRDDAGGETRAARRTERVRHA